MKPFESIFHFHQKYTIHFDSKCLIVSRPLNVSSIKRVFDKQNELFSPSDRCQKNILYIFLFLCPEQKMKGIHQFEIFCDVSC